MRNIKLNNLIFLSILLLLIFPGCKQDNPNNLKPEVRILTLLPDGELMSLPTDIDTLRIIVTDDSQNILSESMTTVVSLQENDNQLVISNLPTDMPISITIIANKGTNTLYSAQIDSLVLQNGQRLFLDLMLTKLKAFSILPQDKQYHLAEGIFGHQATLLSDDRLLITGGFRGDTISPLACPAHMSKDAICFYLEATDEAYIIDTGSYKIYPLEEKMLEKRAFHTATLLQDGNVIIAGGVDQAVLAFEPLYNSDQSEITGYLPSIEPVIKDGIQGALNSFEIFDPNLNAESFDYLRDRDILKGGFKGAPASPSKPGVLNYARFLHSAYLIPESEGKILFAGGLGSNEASYTGEIFDVNRPGGSGVYNNADLIIGGINKTVRYNPALIPFENDIWVIGGSYQSEQASDIIEIWNPSESLNEPNGSFASPDCENWPDQITSSKLNFLFPRADYLGVNKTYIYVNGWFGVTCDPNNDSIPVYIANKGVICKYTNQDQSYLINPSTCEIKVLSTPIVDDSHALGTLTSLIDGRIMLAGGFGNGQTQNEHAGFMYVTDVVDFIKNELNEYGFPQRVSGEYSLNSPRALHTATKLKGGRVLLIGGIVVGHGTNELPVKLTLLNSVEVFNSGWTP